MTETWGYIDSGKSNPYYNMALDEKLMEWHREGKTPPIVRFYGWEPATLSVGYFQKVEKDIDLEAVKRHGLGFVRRPTGGRAVLHEDELTYSVIVSEDHPQMPDSVTEAYRVISQGLLEGFIDLGLDASFSVPRSEEERNNLKNPRSAVCFDASSWYELVVEGRKIAGSAQTRQKGVVLQHGSIILSLDEDKLFDVFNYPSERVRERMQRSFKNKAVAIEELLGEKIDVEQAKEAFRTGFEKGLGIDLIPYILSEEEGKEIEKLMEEKYSTDAWNFKS
ncbi:lipoate--protein ligase family protein [Alteribacter populi]|uniref:lipoate--protein ligase family protein n=1 Tax=Alteribacter populi TaxID=2011011 RepID=UPI000BBAF6D2|nr:biotin/lipoate A/B protein ligase family protein [Alteribacter populi]